MTREFLPGSKPATPFPAELIKKTMSDRQVLYRATEPTELSLGRPSSPPFAPGTGIPSPEPEPAGSTCRKRKSSGWEPEPSRHTGIELQLKDPLPRDWEQCLDLQSGSMYYLNRKTLKKSWDLPKDQTLDLELNISPPQGSDRSAPDDPLDVSAAASQSLSAAAGGGMVAVACLRCHLLVMLCTSSPTCPNCKYVHPLPPPARQPPASSAAAGSPRTLETLSLLY